MCLAGQFCELVKKRYSKLVVSVSEFDFLSSGDCFFLETDLVTLSVFDLSVQYVIHVTYAIHVPFFRLTF